jgi:hypothetical protein
MKEEGKLAQKIHTCASTQQLASDSRFRMDLVRFYLRSLDTLANSVSMASVENNESNEGKIEQMRVVA